LGVTDCIRPFSDNGIPKTDRRVSPRALVTQALNRQLVEDLPKLTDLSRAALVSILKTLAKVEFDFGQQCAAACAEAIPQDADAKNSNTHRGEHRARLSAIVQSMLDSQSMFDFKDLARDFGGLMPQRGPTFSMRRRESSQDFAAARSASRTSVDGDGAAQQKKFPPPESEKFANAVCQWEYIGETEAEATLSVGESVVVLSRSDNTGNSDWCKVRVPTLPLTPVDCCQRHGMPTIDMHSQHAARAFLLNRIYWRRFGKQMGVTALFRRRF
jgi:hypothetical protein